MGFSDSPKERRSAHFTRRYRSSDAFKGYPSTSVESVFTERQVGALVDTGVLVVRSFLADAQSDLLYEAIKRIAEYEIEYAGGVPVRGNGYYVRNLVYKDSQFHHLLSSEAVGLARILLGPQVQMRVDARVAFAGVPDAGVGWHLHFPGSFDPVPPWHSAPHSLHCLVYLDDVGPEEGELVVLPESYLDPFLDPAEIEEGDTMTVSPHKGDCVMIHGNTWHRTNSTSSGARSRIVLFLGFTAAWVQGDSNAGGQPKSGLKHSANPFDSWSGTQAELDELLGRFRW